MNYPYFASIYRWLVASQVLNMDLRGPKILDVGCDDAGFLARSTAPLRLGIDLQPRVQSMPGVTIMRADARALPMCSETFDAVLAFDILEHIEQDRRVMHELLRVLAPHGTLWFSTPALRSEIWPWFVQPYANRSFGHVRNGYTPEQMRALLPDPDAWQLDLTVWNEPALRAGFLVMDAWYRVFPPVAERLAQLSFELDSKMPNGDRGHLFGRITRKASPLAHV